MVEYINFLQAFVPRAIVSPTALAWTSMSARRCRGPVRTTTSASTRRARISVCHRCGSSQSACRPIPVDRAVAWTSRMINISAPVKRDINLMEKRVSILTSASWIPIFAVRANASIYPARICACVRLAITWWTGRVWRSTSAFSRFAAVEPASRPPDLTIVCNESKF